MLPTRRAGGEARVGVPGARTLRADEVTERWVDGGVGHGEDRGERLLHRGQRDVDAFALHDRRELATTYELEPTLACPSLGAHLVRRAERVRVATKDRPEPRAAELEARAEDRRRVGAVRIRERRPFAM